MIDLESYVREMRARSVTSKHAHKPTVRTADNFISWEYFQHFYDGNICGGLNVENRHTPLASSDSADLPSISEAAFFKKRAILLYCPIALFEQFLTNVLFKS